MSMWRSADLYLGTPGTSELASAAPSRKPGTGCDVNGKRGGDRHAVDGSDPLESGTSLCRDPANGIVTSEMDLAHSSLAVNHWKTLKQRQTLDQVLSSHPSSNSQLTLGWPGRVGLCFSLLLL